MKNIVLLFFIVFSFTLYGQTIHYISYGSGISYSKLSYIDAPEANEQFVKGMDVGFHAGIGISSLRSSTLGAEIMFVLYRFPETDQDIFFFSNYQSKVNYKLFSKFDFKTNYAFKPYIALNYYGNTDRIPQNKGYSYEYGTSFILKKKRVWYELQFSSFPEFDHLKYYSQEEKFYRKYAIHYPYIGLNMNVLLDDVEGLKMMKELRNDYYFNKLRQWRIEAGYVQIASGFGFAFIPKRPEDKKASYEIGFRSSFSGAYQQTGLFNSYLFYGLKYNWKENKPLNYALNWGMEFGGGFLLTSGTNNEGLFPYPHLMAFLENEFTRFYIRAGAGTGFYGTIGYKLF